MPETRQRPADRPPARGRMRLPARTRRRARLEAILLGPAVDATIAAAGLLAELEQARAHARRLEHELRELTRRTGHVLLVGGPRGYELRHADGPAPAAGSMLAAGRLLVARVGPSPLPGDRRRCAFVLPT
jgi:hypothetical protein